MQLKRLRDHQEHSIQSPPNPKKSPSATTVVLGETPFLFASTLHINLNKDIIKVEKKHRFKDRKLNNQSNLTFIGLRKYLAVHI